MWSKLLDVGSFSFSLFRAWLCTLIPGLQHNDAASSIIPRIIYCPSLASSTTSIYHKIHKGITCLKYSLNLSCTIYFNENFLSTNFQNSDWGGTRNFVMGFLWGNWPYFAHIVMSKLPPKLVSFKGSPDVYFVHLGWRRACLLTSVLSSSDWD